MVLEMIKFWKKGYIKRARELEEFFIEGNSNLEDRLMCYSEGYGSDYEKLIVEDSMLEDGLSCLRKWEDEYRGLFLFLGGDGSMPPDFCQMRERMVLIEKRIFDRIVNY